ncbi:MAG TPA: hypothetical protein IAC03_02430 [Candidatus Coprenecus pullistercoris]|nr:hypothetical protein [Candidatus Coprenecus pullistercoris]
MKELKEIKINEKDIILQDNLVRSSILPEKIAELTRNVVFKGDNVVEGPVFANRMEIQNGNLEIHGAVFSQQELYVNNAVKGKVEFRKCVGSSSSVVSRSPHCELIFCSDINAKSVILCNAFVAGSIYADEVTLENCVVIGGVFATQSVELVNSIVGTFNTPSIKVSGIIQLLLPSAFSVEKMVASADTRLYNLSLADLGALYKGQDEAANSGKIEMQIEADEIKSNLVDSNMQKTLRSYTVVGKVLAADLLDTDKFQNHFLLAAASLGAQLLKTYDLGVDKDGKPALLSVEKIRAFFFDIMAGRIQIKTIDGRFDISQITGRA